MFLVLTVEDNVLHKLLYLDIDRSKTEKVFYDKCKEWIPNWDDYTEDDIDHLWETGCAIVPNGNRSIMFIDTSSLASDDEIAGMVEYQKICKKLNRE